MKPSLFLMGRAQSPEGPRALAHNLKPLAIPDTGLQQTTIFNASHSFSDDLSIIKHLKLSCVPLKKEKLHEMTQANYRI